MVHGNGLDTQTTRLVQDQVVKLMTQRHKEKVAILFLDLDRFKVINDCLGHSFGDKMLQQLATRLQACAREQDSIARLGGDEFLFVSPVKESADAARMAERIIRETKEAFVIQGHVLNVTCSIGISIYPDHGEDAETLIKNADAAMYSSKDEGRNTFRFFTTGMTAQATERLQLESRLRTAIEEHQFFLMYQPEIELTSGNTVCWEALLRWRHPELGLIPPDMFIRIAESSGMIVPIGEWVLRNACAQAKQWRDEGRVCPHVAVNVSAVQFRNEGFCNLVRSVLRETGLPPMCLELELTESLLLSNEDVMFQVLGELKEMGVRLAIDDFGTGYSSLSYLKQFPVSKLKIDRSFIRDLFTAKNDVDITAAIINLAKCLKLNVTAEGVETESQLAFLKTHGCDQVQGYIFSKPLTADQISSQVRCQQPAQRCILVRCQLASRTVTCQLPSDSRRSFQRSHVFIDHPPNDSNSPFLLSSIDTHLPCASTVDGAPSSQALPPPPPICSPSPSPPTSFPEPAPPSAPASASSPTRKSPSSPTASPSRSPPPSPANC